MPFRWTEATGMQAIALPTTYTEGNANAISDDNSTIVGSASRTVDIGGVSTGQSFATRTRGSTIDVLGDLAGGPDSSYAAAVSADGSIVVGGGAIGGMPRSPTYHAFIWDATNGMRDLRGVLTDQGLNLTGWTLTRATDISGDGSVIVGAGTFNGVQQGWIAVVPEPGSFALLTLATATALNRRHRLCRLPTPWKP